jgi:thiamine biosynthesis protein ThiS
MQLTLNGRAREIDPGTDLLELLADLRIEPRVVIVEHNGRILRPGDFEGVDLSAGDRVEIVHFVGGG